MEREEDERKAREGEYSVFCTTRGSYEYRFKQRFRLIRTWKYS